MNTLSWWLVENTLTVALLIPIVALACRLFRNRPAVQHLLWAVVLLKFITPPLAEWPWSVPRLGPWAHSVSATDLSSPLAVSSEREAARPSWKRGPAAPRTTAMGFRVPRAARGPCTTAPVGGKSESRDDIARSPDRHLGLGFVVSAARQVRRIKRHASLVRRRKKAPQSLTLEIEAVALEVSVRPPRALVTGGIVSPFTWFLGPLCLVWPEAMSGRADVMRSPGVIAHELAHVRRGDHYLAWLEPLPASSGGGTRSSGCPPASSRIGRARLRRDRPLGLQRLPSNLRRAPARTLIRFQSPFLAPVLAIGATSTASFERRLSMILSDRVSGRVPAWGLAAAALLALVSLPGWSVAQKPPERHRPDRYCDRGST